MCAISTNEFYLKKTNEAPNRCESIRCKTPIELYRSWIEAFKGLFVDFKGSIYSAAEINLVAPSSFFSRLCVTTRWSLMFKNSKHLIYFLFSL